MGAERCDDDPGCGNFGWRDIRPLADAAEGGHPSGLDENAPRRRA
jgi:hypothetical protein